MLSFETMKLFFGMLAVGANIVVVGYVLLRVASRFSPAAERPLAQVHDLLKGYELTFGAIAAGTATFGSLYLSEIENLIPCTDCWYQRIAMYPIFVILAIAAVRKDTSVRLYSSVLAVIGSVIAIYHYLIQWFPELEGTSCTTAIPCTFAWFRVFGFISIPYMALSAFTLVLVMMAALKSNTADHEADAIA